MLRGLGRDCKGTRGCKRTTTLSVAVAKKVDFGKKPLAPIALKQDVGMAKSSAWWLGAKMHTILVNFVDLRDRKKSQGQKSEILLGDPNPKFVVWAPNFRGAG